jgi:hypothetical protein
VSRFDSSKVPVLNTEEGASFQDANFMHDKFIADLLDTTATSFFFGVFGRLCGRQFEVFRLFSALLAFVLGVKL